MLGRRREPVEATVITHRVVKQVRYDSTDPGKTYDVREVIVEFPAPDGTIVRLSITEKAYKFVLPEPGSTVPILVNADHTKASFDLADQRIGAKIAQRAQHQEEQAEANARFDAALESGGADAHRARAAEADAVVAIEHGDDDLDILAAMDAAEEAEGR